MKKLFVLFVLLISLSARAEDLRVLCSGIVNYADGRTRLGGYNSTLGVYDALSFAHPDAKLTLLSDATKSDLLSAIKRELTGADTSIVYINCHGGAQGELSWLECADGGIITARELKEALDGVGGQIMLILDCCNSGGFIGEGDYPDAFASGILRPFGGAGNTGVNLFSSSQYLVCVSCSYDQNSYRIASDNSEAGMSTVFSKALCEALGWDLTHDRATTFKADTDSDHQVSFTEMCLYVRQRCMYYLSLSSTARQTVQFTQSAVIVAGRDTTSAVP